MNVPAIAARNYEKLKGDLYFRKIVKFISTKVKKIKDPIKRARFFHQQIDEKIDEITNDEFVKNNISCKKGCSACCHSQVTVTRSEADLLAHVLENKKIEIDFEKLEKQANAQNSSSSFYRLSFEARGCVMLDDQGNCQIYEDRPAVCRTNYVVSDPELCSTEDGKERPVSLLKTFEADMVIYGAYSVEKEAGALPYMLVKALSKKSEKKLRKNPDQSL
ncbi:MAG: YkgJ family cysteine cluster protein [Oligoflexia bacterium]|nr:YkgJ family cysteine cluster protein [Oligoflexia bacterium]